MNQLVDIIIPAYNEGTVLYDNIVKISEVLAADGVEHRFILVNDGSSDATWAEILRLSERFPTLCGVCFSRNFGKEAAICAGLMEVTAGACIVMDCDLQHPPQMIKAMVEKWQEGHPLIECVKSSRGKEGFFSKMFAKLFYAVFKGLASFDFDNSSDFKLMDKTVVDSWKELGDSNVFFRGMMEWMGYTKVQIPFEVQERSGGESKFSFFRLMKLAFSAITSFSVKPLFLTVIISLLFMLGAIGLTVQTLVNKFSGHAVSGFTTTIILILLVGSLTLLCMSVIGVYIARIYEEVKGRPRFVVMKKVGQKEQGAQQ